MKFKAGNSYELPVKERIVQGNSQYFIVEHDGVEYRIPLSAFQKEQKDNAAVPRQAGARRYYCVGAGLFGIFGPILQGRRRISLYGSVRT